MGFRLSTGLRNAMMNNTGFKGGMDGGILKLFSGTIPADADSDEGSGTLLLEVTLNGDTLAENGGLIFDTATEGSSTKPENADWRGVGAATGTAYWFRLYDSNETTGASTTALRLDGTVGTSNADLVMSSTSITSGATTVMDNATFTLPAS